jgi:hypothetical protein
VLVELVLGNPARGDHCPRKLGMEQYAPIAHTAEAGGMQRGAIQEVEHQGVYRR